MKMLNRFVVRWPRDWRWWSVAVPLVISLYQCQGQGTVQITFDRPPVSPVVVPNYSESGILFTAILDPQGYGGIYRVPSWAMSYPYNGTAFIQCALISPVEVTSRSGLPFGLISVDLAEQLKTIPNAVTAQFTGYRLDGSSVTASFTTDGIIGMPGVHDFQTFYFGPEFESGFSRVVISPGFPYLWSLDNLVVSIPEPNLWPGVLLGITGYFGMRRLNRRSYDRRQGD